MKMSNQPLTQILESSKQLGLLQNIEIPDFITQNIKHELRDYQIDTLKRFIYYVESSNMENFRNDNFPSHLLFNMATGSGKTLIMACLILYYYKLGYRKFIFFVDQKNIVNKTEDNLFNKYTTKYLFKEKIILDNRNIEIKKVKNFSSDNLNIEIIFTTTHQIHLDFYSIKENKASELEYKNDKMVMISDECHHLNSLTKKGQSTKSGKEENSSWENTIINKILKNNTNDKENVLLEFTATVPEDFEVQKKYENKKIIDLDLKEFVKQKYTKEVNLLYGNFNKKEKIILSLILNFIREKIANKNKIFLKPVILFKSKLIEDSKNDFKFFLNLVENLKEIDFNFLKNIFRENDLTYSKNTNSIFNKLKKTFEKENIEFSEIVRFVKNNFQRKYCIITNSEDKKTTKGEELSKDKEKLLNTLEDKENRIRAIFTVDRLCEGWDVLNLFEIVRLYEGQNTGGANKGASKTTISEVQLIGRGVRYFDFKFEEKEIYKRKFDKDLNNELRYLEEFFYISDKDHRYITDLKNELIRQGLYDEKRRIKVKLKEVFKKSKIFKMNKILKNDKIENPNKRKSSFREIIENLRTNFSHTNEILEDEVFNKKLKTDIESYQKNKEFLISNYRNIFYKAISINRSFYNFQNLKKYINIDSITDLLDEEKFLKNQKINIRCSTHINNKILLNFFNKYLNLIEKKLKEEYEPYIGSDFEFFDFKEIFDIEKEIFISDKVDRISHLNLIDKMKKEDSFVYDDFIFDSGYEPDLLKFIYSYINELKQKYKEIHIIRNYETYKIYSKKNGAGFTPDFLLFLVDDKSPKYYQILIEAKGEHLKVSNGWKENLLKLVNDRNIFKKEILNFENEKWRLIGLPFYYGKKDNENSKFKEKFEEKLNIKKEINEFKFNINQNK